MMGSLAGAADCFFLLAGARLTWIVPIMFLLITLNHLSVFSISKSDRKTFSLWGGFEASRGGSSK